MKRFLFAAILILAAAHVASLSTLTVERSEESVKRCLPLPALSQGEDLMGGRSLTASRSTLNEDVVGDRYAASVDGGGMTLTAHDVRFRTGLVDISCGDAVWTATPGRVIRESTSSVQIHRGAVVEEYRFEDGRVEQLFTIAEPMGEGAIQVRVSAETNLTAQAAADPGPAWSSGIWFRDASSERRLSYHTAVAIDAGGRQANLEIRHKDGEISLTVPASFLATAEYPLVVDPWIELAGSATGGGISGSGDVWTPSLAVDANGVPYVAWSQSTPYGYRIYVRTLTASGWTGLGGSDVGHGIVVSTPSYPLGNSTSPSLALDPAGRPVVAWEQALNPSWPTYKIHVRAWNGYAWTGLGGSDLNPGIAAGDSYSPSLKVSRNGQVMVAWSQSLGLYSDIHFKMWDGSSWIELAGSATYGGVSYTAGQSAEPSLALHGPTGIPAIAWTEYPLGSTGGGSGIYLRYWNGASWAELSGSATGDGLSGTSGYDYSPSLAIDDSGVPYVAWRFEGMISHTHISSAYVRTWNGNWVDLGGSASSTGISGAYFSDGKPSLALSHIGGMTLPVVAWEGSTLATRDVFMNFWNPWSQAWEGLEGSTSPGGVSGTPGLGSAFPSLAINPWGLPVITWQEYSGSGVQYSIHLRTWTP